jgi:hypothetical protein
MGDIACARHRVGAGRINGGTADECKGRSVASAFMIALCFGVNQGALRLAHTVVHFTLGFALA